MSQLPSPEKAAVFVYHAAAPDVIERVALTSDWEVFLEVVRSRLHMRTLDNLIDSGTGEGGMTCFV